MRNLMTVWLGLLTLYPQDQNNSGIKYELYEGNSKGLTTPSSKHYYF